MKAGDVGHVIVDVVGYFALSAAMTLDCQFGARLQHHLDGASGYATHLT